MTYCCSCIVIKWKGFKFIYYYYCHSSSEGFKEYVVGYGESESAPPMESSMLNGIESAELAYPLYEPGLPQTPTVTL